MILRPVLLPLSVDPNVPASQRVQQQRASARRALDLCATVCEIPEGSWLQDEHDVPLPRDGYHWSVSHKPTCAAAVVADGPVGIDVERMIPRRERLHEAVARDDEWRIVRGRDWPDFFRVWTAKEAALKANGAGIAYLRDCSVVAVDEMGRMWLRFRGRDWAIAHYEFGDHIAAITDVGDRVEWRLEAEVGWRPSAR